MTDFQPTFLYIKQHSTTGKYYFGKTYCKDPIKYNGSGIHWGRHIKKHGKDNVKTLWHELFTNKEDCTEFALFFSGEMNIVKSDQWLNLKPENGLDGGGRFGPRSVEEIEKMSLRKGEKHKPCPEERKLRISTNLQGIIRSDETKEKISIANKNRSSELQLKMTIAMKEKLQSAEFRAKMSKPQPIVSCPHCSVVGGNSAMKRHHFNNCKDKI